VKIILRLISLLLLLTFLLLAFPAAAQDDLTQVIDLPEGYAISAPEDWDLQADDNSDGVYLNNADFTVYILTPPQVAEVVTLGKSPDVVDLMVDINVALFDWEPDADSIDSVQVAGHPASRVYYDLEGDEFEGVSYVIEMGDLAYAFVDGVASIGQIDELEDILLPMLRTFKSADEAVSAASREPCFVSTDSRDTARLRVGPGENRSSVAFLPAGDDFEVQGQFVDDDGNVWYQLDKDAAAPQSAATEIWVAQADVSESGDCDAVVDASAPPVVPITNNSNPPANTDSGSNTNQGGAVPAGGLWTVTLNSEADASCADTGNFHVPTTEVFNPTSFQVVILVSGNTLFFDGSPFSRTNSGAYFGSIQISNGNAQLTLSVANANTITGQMVANAVFDGRACSTTIGLTATR
jgi:hypothetical protein